MDVELPKAGKYVVAVSGGVDSMALLHMVSRRKGLDLVVAHLDHGIRPDSSKDRKLVQAVAKKYGLPFVYEEARLGPGASEATARTARYDFLRRVREQQKAPAIITAHHQDDVLETAIINLLRGTGRKGLTALKSRPGVARPLLDVPKARLRAYAKDNDLSWSEDPTNENIDYLRNYVRHKLLPRFGRADRERMLGILTDMAATNEKLDAALEELLKPQVEGVLNRQWFSQLPHTVAREVIAAWLRAHKLREFDKKTLERLVVAGKTAAPGKVFPVLSGAYMRVQTDNLALEVPER